MAEDVRRRFDRITRGRLSDQVRDGRSSGRGDRVAPQDGRAGRGAGEVRGDQHRRGRGGSR
nr:hypothetical protein [Micromonospora sp. HNM0581]